MADENPFFDWLTSKSVEDLAGILIELSGLPLAETGKKWREDYLNTIEQHLMKKGLKKGEFELQKKHLAGCFELFKRKDFLREEVSMNQYWAIFVIGWLAMSIRGAISLTNQKGKKRFDMPSMHG